MTLVELVYQYDADSDTCLSYAAKNFTAYICAPLRKTITVAWIGAVKVMYALLLL
jgi:hypothetical protein